MLSLLEIKIIRRIQEDIPIVSEPYKDMAKELGISEEKFLEKIKELSDRGILRRFGAILNHINAGFKDNAMVVWKVPDEKIKETVQFMVSFKEVSHCYRRPISPSWPYNIFTMIHGETKNQCEKIVEDISNVSHINDFNILYSTHEFKKISMKYFDY